VIEMESCHAYEVSWKESCSTVNEYIQWSCRTWQRESRHTLEGESEREICYTCDEVVSPPCEEVMSHTCEEVTSHM